MAKLTEAQYKEKYEKEKKRLEAIERKKELAKQKRSLVGIIYKINIIKFLTERK